MRVVAEDVRCQICLKRQKTKGKRLMEVVQGGRVRANHNDTVLFGGAKIAAVGGLVWWDKDKRRDAHGHEVGPVLANVRIMRGSVALVCKAGDSIKHVGRLGLLDENTAGVGQSSGGREKTCGGIVAMTNVRG